MSRARNPFSKGAVLALLAVGSLAFLVLLYAIGQGWTGSGERDGGAHARSNGLNGYSGLASLLEDTGHEVEVSRNRARLDDYALAIITPQHFSDPADLAEALDNRRARNAGPTIVILPKWFAMPVPADAGAEAEPGWVILQGARPPFWLGQLDWARGSRLAIGRTQGWRGFGASGSLPAREQVQALVMPGNAKIDPLVVDSGGHVLAGYLMRGNGNPDHTSWPELVVFEPDLLNNFGLADRARAQAALALVEAAGGGEDLPIILDMTVAGLGASENLLTLAFRPPFLAATLCLLLAALVIGWRAFHRFGPPLAEAAPLTHGKRQLALNGASLMARVKRYHLLKAPYEALVGRRLASRLGLRVADLDARESAIDRVLRARGISGPGFTELAADLRAAKHPRDIIRAASALRAFERNLVP